jgi:undecaprenyl-diphosphatase
MLQVLRNIDQAIFFFINGLHHPVLDYLMRVLSEKYTWFPLYAVILVMLFWRFGRRAYTLVLLLVAGVAASDQLASHVIKPLVARLRPCHVPAFADLVHVVHGCGGQYGFVSSHASNSFMLATLLWLLFGLREGRLAWFFVWAMAISYSRVYMGVHYPADVIAGALLGMLVAGLLYFTYGWLGQRGPRGWKALFFRTGN